MSFTAFADAGFSAARSRGGQLNAPPRRPWFGPQPRKAKAQLPPAPKSSSSGA